MYAQGIEQFPQRFEFRLDYAIQFHGVSIKDPFRTDSIGYRGLDKVTFQDYKSLILHLQNGISHPPQAVNMLALTHLEYSGIKVS